ncbi:hypothetical protein AAVH_15517 [Aphelenchoides avenae]|nr:hypothetical protein AAVH_15517 [Aphelenchus avenae]
MTRRKALQLGVVIPSVMEEDTKAKTRKSLSMEDELATEVDEAAAAAASLNLVTEQWFVDAGIEVQQYHAYGPIDHDTAAEDLARFFHATLSDSGFVGEDDFGAAENVALPVPWNNDATVEELIGGLPSVNTRLDQDNSVDAETLETPVVEPLMDDDTNVADADQQPNTRKTCERGSKKNAASQAAAVKNAKAAAKRKDVRKEVVVGIGQRLRASRKYNLRSKKELQRSARHSTKASFR